jgi:hypothetical protein
MTHLQALDSLRIIQSTLCMKNRLFLVVFGLSLLIFYISDSYLNQLVVYIAQAFNYSNMLCSVAHFVCLFSPNKESDLGTVHNQVPGHLNTVAPCTE